MRHMKKIVIGLLVMLISLTAVLTLVACGVKAPSYISDPPATAAELETKLEEEGWDVWSEEGILMAEKFDKDISTLGENDTVTMEFMEAMYCPDSTTANLMKAAFDGILDGIKKEIKGTSFSGTVIQKGNIVILYVKATGKASDITI